MSTFTAKVYRKKDNLFALKGMMSTIKEILSTIMEIGYQNSDNLFTFKNFVFTMKEISSTFKEIFILFMARW